MNDLSLLTFNYNTPELIEDLLISFFTHYKKIVPVVIFENGIECLLSSKYNEIFNIIDNKNYKITGEHGNISRNHSASIDYALKNIIDTKYCLICDSDVKLLPDITKVIDMKDNYDLIGHITYEEYVKPERIHPCCCIINVEKFKKEKRNYYDPLRCIIPNITNITRTYIKYDTGASFYEDVKNSWKILNIPNINDFYIHYQKGSHKSDDY